MRYQAGVHTCMSAAAPVKTVKLTLTDESTKRGVVKHAYRSRWNVHVYRARRSKVDTGCMEL